MPKPFSIMVLVAAALLSGCNATLEEFVKKTDQTLDSLSTNGKPVAITNFEANAKTEQLLLADITKQAQAFGQTWWYTERKVRVKAKNMFNSESSATVVVAGGFRLSLPQDSLDVKSLTLKRVIESMAMSIEKRNAWDESNIYISAMDDATSQWIRRIIEFGLVNKKLAVVAERGPASVGWISSGLAERQL